MGKQITFDGAEEELPRAMLQRKTPLRRSPLRRKKPKQRKGANPLHLAFLRKQPCCLCAQSPPSEAHHLLLTGYKGMGRKTRDDWAIPLCASCHWNLHHMKGMFRDQGRAFRARWQVEKAKLFCSQPETLPLLEAPPLELPE